MHEQRAAELEVALAEAREVAAALRSSSGSMSTDRSSGSPSQVVPAEILEKVARLEQECRARAAEVTEARESIGKKEVEAESLIRKLRLAEAQVDFAKGQVENSAASAQADAELAQAWRTKETTLEATIEILRGERSSMVRSERDLKEKLRAAEARIAAESMPTAKQPATRLGPETPQRTTANGLGPDLSDPWE